MDLFNLDYVMSMLIELGKDDDDEDDNGEEIGAKGSSPPASTPQPSDKEIVKKSEQMVGALEGMLDSLHALELKQREREEAAREAKFNTKRIIDQLWKIINEGDDDDDDDEIGNGKTFADAKSSPSTRSEMKRADSLQSFKEDVKALSRQISYLALPGLPGSDAGMPFDLVSVLSMIEMLGADDVEEGVKTEKALVTSLEDLLDSIAAAEKAEKAKEEQVVQVASDMQVVVDLLMSIVNSDDDEETEDRKPQDGSPESGGMGSRKQSTFRLAKDKLRKVSSSSRVKFSDSTEADTRAEGKSSRDLDGNRGLPVAGSK